MNKRLGAACGIAIVVMISGPITMAGGIAAAQARPSSSTPGYQLVGADLSAYAFNAPSLAALPDNPTLGQSFCTVPPAPGPFVCAAIGIAATNLSQGGPGYWMGEAGHYFDASGNEHYAGGVLGFGNTNTCAGNSSVMSNAPVVGVAAEQGGALLVGADGGIFAFCSAQFYGSMGGHPLNQPIVGIAATPDGQGYWLVASDGGIFSFGDASFYGSMGGLPLNKPIVGMASTPDGKGYWLVASDGGIFSFGDATFAGSEGGVPLVAPMVAIAANPDGTGYWTVAADGGVFSFGDAPFLGSPAGRTTSPITGIAATG